jgi:cytochrome P450
MLLRICERTTIVVSSAEAVGEMFKRHDTAFSERPSSSGIEELSRYWQGVIFAPYGDHWRRILMTELLSSRRVEAFRRIREDEAARLVSSLSSSSLSPGQPSVDMEGPDMDERVELCIADSSCAPSWRPPIS